MSYLNLGYVPLSQMKKKITAKTLIRNQIGPGSHGPIHPPRNRVVTMAATVNMWAYSAIMKVANFMLLYSILNPHASSLSDSGISKGVLLISASPATR